MKKTVFLFLVLSMLLVIVAPIASALEINIPTDPIKPQYELASLIQAILSKSGQTASCGARIQGKNVNDQISLTMTLKKKSGNSWLYTDSWSGSGTFSATLSETTDNLSPGTYKLFVSGTLSRGSTSEYVSNESKEITI
jgi:hypothetical protein